MRETTMQTPRSVKKEREEVLRSRDTPAARGERAGCPPAAHGGLTAEQRFPCSPWRTPRRSRWLGPEKAVTLWESPRWSSSWRTAARGKDSRWRSSWRTVCCGRDPTLEQGKSVRSPPPEEEGASETTCDELTATPIPRPPVLLGREEVEESGAKLSPGRREGWGEGVFLRYDSISHHPTLI